MEFVSVRVACLKDKQRVLAMRDDVYSGFDFLPSYYDFFVESQSHIPFVAELHGQIVGFVTASLVDGGETVVDRAGRVSKEFEGRGLYKHMLQEVGKQLLAFKKIKRKALCALQDNYKVNSPSFRQRHSLILTRAIRTYSVENISSKLLQPFISSYSEASFLDENELKIFISKLTEEETSYLFPKRRIVVDWVPFRLKANNVPLMNGPNTVYLTDVHKDSRKLRGLFSASTQHPLQQIGRLCHIDVYGTDTSSLTNHLSIHIQLVMQMSKVKTYFFVYTDHEITDGDVDSSMNALGVQRDFSSPKDNTGSSICYKELMVYESYPWKIRQNE